MPANVETLPESPRGQGGNAASNVEDETGPDCRALAEDAGCLGLTREAARAVGPRDGLELMIAHQMAAAHKVAMTLAGRAAAHAKAARPTRLDPIGDERHAAEAARAAAASARMMAAFQAGAMTLDRMRHGIRQTITVEHLGGS